MPSAGNSHDLAQSVLRGNAGAPQAAVSTWRRLLLEPKFRKRALRYALGLPVPLETEDRRVLEQVVFEYFLGLPAVRDILFVGCDWYTRHYERRYFAARNYWTLDVAQDSRKNGARQHIVAPLEELARHFSPQSLDLILCNGVFGFGLDSRAQCEAAFGQCRECLRVGGYFVLGWTDIPARTPVALDELESLGRFRKFAFPPLQSWRYRTRTPYRQTYDFYLR